MQYTVLDTAWHDSKDTGVNAHEYSISAQAPASTSKWSQWMVNRQLGERVPRPRGLLLQFSKVRIWFSRAGGTCSVEF